MKAYLSSQVASSSNLYENITGQSALKEEMKDETDLDNNRSTFRSTVSSRKYPSC